RYAPDFAGRRWRKCSRQRVRDLVSGSHAFILLKGRHRRKTSEGRENSFAAFGALADGFVQDFPDCAGQWFLIQWT
ncbi:MAG: hypothetical protein RSA12_11005, partial [Clostridia bacterium]